MYIKPYFSDSDPIAFGDRGPAVGWLQERLNAHGYSIAIDEQFGSKTLAAVKSFQTAQGLRVDGMVGTQTGPALAASPYGPIPAPPQIPVSYKPAPSRVVVTETKNNNDSMILLFLILMVLLLFKKKRKKR